MSIFEIIIDRSLEATIMKAVQDELGEISVQVTCQDKSRYLIKIQDDVELTGIQESSIKNSIITTFEQKGLIVSSQAWQK